MNFLNTMKKLFWISRPISWPNTAYPFAVGYVIAGSTAGLDLPLLVIGTLYFLGPYNLLMYGVNDVYDYESDIKNPRKGGVEGMREARAFHPTILKACLYTNAPFLLYLFWVIDWPARAVLALVMFAVVAYSLKGLRFKEKPVLDSITSSLHFTGPLLFALAIAGFPAAAWPFIAAFFIWGMASHAYGAVQDIIPDKKGGLHSIATAFGARTTVIVAWIGYLGAAAIIALQGAAFWGIAVAGLLYALNITGDLTITNKTSGKANKGWKRFLWLNYLSGAVVTITIVALSIGL